MADEIKTEQEANKKPAPKPDQSEYIKVDRANPDFMHIENEIERIAAQIRPGQFFKNSSHAVIEIVGVQEGHVMFKFIKGGITGKRVFPANTFAALFNNKYYMQIKNPDQKIDWELNKAHELERYLR